NVTGVQTCALPISTIFALVAVGFFVAGIRTRSLYITIRQKHLRLCIIELFLCLLDQYIFFVKVHKKLLGSLMMLRRTCAPIIVKAHPELFKSLLIPLVVAINNILWGYIFIFCSNGNGNAVLI